jgi:hypothetical protein
MLAASISHDDLGCVKTYTLAKCKKYSSLTWFRTVSAQYDLTLIMRNRFEIFYARGGRWSFYTAKTQTGTPFRDEVGRLSQ